MPDSQKIPFFGKFDLFFPSSLKGQNLSNPDEDVEGVGVDADAVVDRVVLSSAPNWKTYLILTKIMANK